MVSKGRFMGLDWNRITRLHSQVIIGTQEVKNSLTASRCHLKAYWSFALTSVIYAVSFTDFGQFHRFRLISPKTLFALDVIVSMCGDYLILLSSTTPR